MSNLVKVAFMLMLATSAFAESNAFTDKAVPTMVTTGTVAAANAAVPTPQAPENRTVALVVGIAAVAATFHRAFFRGRQAGF